MNKNTINSIILVAGRVLISAIFLRSGFGKIMDFSGTADYMGTMGMPLPALFLLGAIVFEIVGGFSLILGFRARWGAALLIAFLIPTTFIFHAFWAVEEARQQMETIQFMKNMAILGGLFTLFVHGAEQASLDACLRNRCGCDKTS